MLVQVTKRVIDVTHQAFAVQACAMFSMLVQVAKSLAVITAVES